LDGNTFLKPMVNHCVEISLDQFIHQLMVCADFIQQFPYHSKLCDPHKVGDVVRSFGEILLGVYSTNALVITMLEKAGDSLSQMTVYLTIALITGGARGDQWRNGEWLIWQKSVVTEISEFLHEEKDTDLYGVFSKEWEDHLIITAGLWLFRTIKSLTDTPKTLSGESLVQYIIEDDEEGKSLIPSAFPSELATTTSWNPQEVDVCSRSLTIATELIGESLSKDVSQQLECLKTFLSMQIDDYRRQTRLLIMRRNAYIQNSLANDKGGIEYDENTGKQYDQLQKNVYCSICFEVISPFHLITGTWTRINSCHHSYHEYCLTEFKLNCLNKNDYFKRWSSMDEEMLKNLQSKYRTLLDFIQTSGSPFDISLLRSDIQSMENNIHQILAGRCFVCDVYSKSDDLIFDESPSPWLIWSNTIDCKVDLPDNDCANTRYFIKRLLKPIEQQSER